MRHRSTWQPGAKIMSSNIEGKVVVITGARSGLGEATARLLCAQGASVVLGARRVDRLQSLLTDDVAWANGMDGGYVHGREAVREYWTRQWSMVSPHVEPVGFHRTADGAIIAEVRQSVRDLEGKPLQGQTHGLRDKTVGHVFRLREGKVARFDIQDAAWFSAHR